MKKVFFLIAFFFTVVCYAAPPPDNSASFLTEDVGVFRSQGDISLYGLEVPEVAFEYIGNEPLVSLAVDFNHTVANCGFINRLHDWTVNKQNTSFGYPFGANY